MRHHWLAVLVGWFLLAPVGPAAAQRFPAFTGERVYVVGVPDTGYGDLLPLIRQVEARAPETYYLVVVDSAGSGPWATRDYVDTLWERWRAEARRSNRRLDPERSVIVVLAVGSRQISLHPGADLQERLGFRGEAIDREVVRPVFVPAARSRGPFAGLQALIPAIDRHLRHQEAAIQARQQAAARRREEEGEQARAALAAGQRPLREVERLLVERTAQGLPTTDLRRELERARQGARHGARLVETDPAAALAAAREASGRLQTVRAQLQQLPARRQQLLAARDGLRRAYAAASARVEQAGREGLGAPGLSAAVDHARQPIDRVNDFLASDFTAAEAAIRSGEAAVRDIESRLAGARAAAAARRRQQFLRTRVLPVTAGALLLLTTLAVLAAARWRHLRLKRGLAARLAAVKAGLVTQMEALDELAKQHARLSVTDPDFTAPMTGSTLAFYQETDTHLRLAWAAWSEVAQQSDGLELELRREHPLGVTRLRAADQSLADVERRAVLAPSLDEARDRLQQLEQAHEQARSAQANLEAVRSDAAARRAALVAAGLPMMPYEAAVAQDAERASGVAAALVPDPLAARQAAEAALPGAAALRDWLARVLAAGDRRRRLDTQAEEIRQRAAATRAQGFLLAEENGNPDPLLAHAREEAAGAWQLLVRGDDAGATRRLEQGESLAGRAAAVIEGQVKARAFCAGAIPARRQESERLSAELQRTRQVESALAAECAPESWAGVRDHADAVQAALPTFQHHVDEAEQCVAVNVQRYFRAAALLEETAAAQAEADRRLRAVSERLAALRVMREQARALAPRLETLGAQAAAFLGDHAHPARAASRAALQAAAASHRAGAGLLPRPAPDWEACLGRLRTAEAGYGRALALAEQDVADHAAAEAARGAAAAACRTAADFLGGRSDDRPAANQRLASARLLLAEAEGEMATAGADWPALGERFGRVRQEAEAALAAAREDVRLAAAARQAMAEAEGSMAAAQRFYGHGVRADTAAARRVFSEAAAAMTTLSYETALQAALAATRAAETARESAARQVREIEAEIHRRMAEEQQRQAAISASSASSGSGASLSSFDSGSSASSFSSGSSQSSW
jgi:hypothetical protein